MNDTSPRSASGSQRSKETIACIWSRSGGVLAGATIYELDKGAGVLLAGSGVVRKAGKSFTYTSKNTGPGLFEIDVTRE